jgi:hypothetical protein
MAWLLLLWQVYLPPSQLWTGPYQGSGPSFLPLAPVQTPVEESTCGSKSEKEQARDYLYRAEYSGRKRSGLGSAQRPQLAQPSPRKKRLIILFLAHCPLEAHLSRAVG